MPHGPLNSMESNGVPLSPISAPHGSNAAATASSSRRSFRKKAAPSPFPSAPPPAPQRHLQPSPPTSSSESTSAPTHARLQRSASDMSSSTSSRFAGAHPHLQQSSQNRNTIVNNDNNGNNDIKTHSELVTSSLGRRRPPLRRIPTPPSRDSPPALPPRRPFPRPGGAVAVAVVISSSPSSSPSSATSTTPDVSTAFFPATQTVLQSTTQTPSFQASSSIATHTHVVFSGHPTRTQIPASSSSSPSSQNVAASSSSSSSPPPPPTPSSSSSSATTTTTTTPVPASTTTPPTSTGTTTTPVLPPRPPPREVVGIDSPHRHRAKPNEYVDSPHLTETSTISPSSTSSSSTSSSSSHHHHVSSPSSSVNARVAPVKKCKTSYARPPPVNRSMSQENLENASRDMKLRQSQTPASDVVGGQQHHRHLRNNNHHNNLHHATHSVSVLTTRALGQQRGRERFGNDVVSTQPVISSGLKKTESSILSSATGGANSSASDSSSSSSSPPPIFARLAGSAGVVGVDGVISSQPPVDSVYCPNCHRCTCEKCVSPRNLPSDWICKKSCYCSAETALDYASCMCCVKGYFYHCAKDSDEDASCADDPCSCGPPRCLSRWACMGLISLFLPCVLCYLPLKGCIDAVEVCYNCCHRRGCRCAKEGKGGSAEGRDSFNSIHNNSRSATSTSINGGGGSVVGGGGVGGGGRRGSLPNSLSISSTAAILPQSGSRGSGGNKSAESPDLRGKFLIEAETY